MVDLRFLFAVIAAIEGFVAAAGLLTPPSLIVSVTGWSPSDDGLFLVKVISVALGSQAWAAWTLRRNPDRGVARALAFYQFGAATVLWIMWLAAAGRGIFSTGLAPLLAGAVVLHYTVGILLVIAIHAQPRADRPA
jgi:hypothetical protein